MSKGFKFYEILFALLLGVLLATSAWFGITFIFPHAQGIYVDNSRRDTIVAMGLQLFAIIMLVVSLLLPKPLVPFRDGFLVGSLLTSIFAISSGYEHSGLMVIMSIISVLIVMVMGYFLLFRVPTAEQKKSAAGTSATDVTELNQRVESIERRLNRVSAVIRDNKF